MVGLDRRNSAESDGASEPTGINATSPYNGADRTGSAAAVARPRPLLVDVRRRNDVAIVQPHGELDLATVETLQAALDGVEKPGRLVLDLRGLTFIDSTGLHLLVALDRRAQRDGFQLTLVAPRAPADKAIQVSGLDQALPFVAADDALGRWPGESPGSPDDGLR
jgi:anti-sigma B factor antagonist